MSRSHKYGAIPTTVNGIRFASKAEAARYAELRLLEKVGEIRELEIQPRYELRAAWNLHGYRDIKASIVGHYVADFRYRKGPRGLLVIEDVKGMRTPMYRWKKRHFEAQYGLTITEIGRPARRRGVGRRKPLQVGQPGKPKRSTKNTSVVLPPQDGETR